MLARLSVTAFCLLLATGPAWAQDKTKPSAPDAEFACSGAYGPDSSEALLIKTFGADNVVTGLVPGPEGTEMLATTVYPGDHLRAMQFGWWDEANRTGLSYVDLAVDQAGPLGLRSGLSPQEVEAINGAPFTIGGFWWDNGGYANIETGTIHDYADCFISLRFAPMADYLEEIDVTAIAGEVQVPSDEPLLAELDVQVIVLSVSYPDPEGDD